jgi:ribosome recycling factor
MADEDLVLEEAEDAMKKSLEALQRDVAKIRTSRANPVLLEGVMVDYYGVPTPLKKLATITAPEPRLLVVQPFDPSGIGGIGGIERAIQIADLGLSPINDGKVLRLPVPELTEERRRELVKTVKKMGEGHKTGVRGGRRDAISMLKDMQKSGELPEDDSKRAQKKIQDLHDVYIEKVDAVIAAKEEEILHI